MSRYQFYRSREWESLIQLLKLERVNDSGDLICEYCGKPIINKYDCIGHHKTYLTDDNYTDATISLNPDNIALVHHRCHNRIHEKLEHKEREVYLVYGSPLAGKRQWVDDNSQAGDLIVDIDSIWSCISGCERYTKPNRLKSIAFTVRDNLLESIRYRRGKWIRAYVLGGYPYKAERERLCDTLGAREIYIDTPKDECIRRLELDETRDSIEWIRYIDNWWDIFSGGF